MISRRSLLATAALTPLASTAMAQPKQDDTTFPGFRRDVLVRWGDRVEFDAPAFDPNNLTAEAAATQFGWDATVLGLAVPPLAADGVPRALLAVAHPTADGRMMFPGGLDRPLVAAGAQGASILNLRRIGANWEVVDGGFQSRRLTAGTLCAVSGPATGSIGEAVQGVLAPHSGCITPWGTLLLADGDPAPWIARLPDRFARAAGAYGWVVEVDPFNPQSVPAKRTALGRFARSGLLATQSADGRAVVFMSDDQVAGYLFRFVSDSPAEAGNAALLDGGTLSVAVPEGGWAVRFVALPPGVATLTAARAAAGLLGAMPFDAPAGMAKAPNGALYLTCRGNPQRPVINALNPRAANPDGHVLLLRPDGRDAAASVFAGEITVLCGGGAAAGPTGWMSRPSSLTRTGTGAMWIGTDASGIAFAQPEMAAVSRVYMPPVGALMGGVVLTPDETTLLSAVRHPGATPSASFDRPATRWPSLRPDMPPQTTIVTLAQG